MARPSSTATIQINISSQNGWVTPPNPTSEHGGIHPVPHGVCVLLNVGGAHHLPAHTARQIAGALANASHIDVIGTDYRIKGIRAALDRALQDLEPPTLASDESAREGNDPWDTAGGAE